jgi:DNA-directed RNA polymerase subunit RPC12/RpoP
MVYYEKQRKAMTEIYKPIEGYEEHYQVSNLGNVKSLPRPTTKGGLLSQENTKSKDAIYKRVTLSKNGVAKRFLVHRLVAAAFISNPDNKPQVNHIDNDTTNNIVSNLEWSTGSENMQHSRKQGRQDIVKEAAAEGRRKAADKRVQEKYTPMLNTNLNGRILLSFFKCTEGKQEYKGNFQCANCGNEFIASLNATLRKQTRDKPLFCRSCSSKQDKDIV